MAPQAHQAISLLSLGAQADQLASFGYERPIIVCRCYSPRLICLRV
jgi:hypothetical protein